MLRTVTALSLFWVGSALAAAPNYDIQLTLPVIKDGQYHRPYVALWIEDENKQAQRSLLVWMEKDKWLPDLKRYWRRVARSDRDTVDAVTGATKGPGTHHVKWDGLNDQGKPLAPGRYALCVEAAREKGGREAVCTNFDYGVTTTATDSGKRELGSLFITLAP